MCSWTSRHVGAGWSMAPRSRSRWGGAALSFGANDVSSTYLETMGIPLVAGRTFTDQEVERGDHVMIISEAIAKRYWPHGDAVGRVVTAPWLASQDSQPRTVVGITK